MAQFNAEAAGRNIPHDGRGSVLESESVNPRHLYIEVRRYAAVTPLHDLPTLGRIAGFVSG